MPRYPIPIARLAPALLLLAGSMWCAATLRAADDAAVERRDAFDAATAYAVPLAGIKIDGRIDDWPKDSIRYPLLNNFGAYGPTHGDQDGYDPTSDLTAYLMVGYDPKAAVIYLAVVVHDDQLVVGRDCYTTDAVEVYFESRPDRAAGTVNRWPVHQYVAVPGDGSYRGLTATGVENPIFNGGPFEQTESSFAATRLGKETIYEFALTLFDSFPGAKTELKPGKRLGFDAVVVDKDAPAEGKPRWTTWGPTGSYKLAHAELLGDLVLVGGAAELGCVSGTISEGSTGKPMPRAFVEAWSGDARAGCARADDQGRFALHLPSGRYQLRPGFAQGIATTQPSIVGLRAGERVNLDPRAEWIALPAPLVKAAQAYGKLSAYSDQTTLKVTEPREEVAPSPPPMSFAFALDRRAGCALANLAAEPNDWRVTYDGQTLARFTSKACLVRINTPIPTLSFGTINPALHGIQTFSSMPLNRFLGSGTYPHRLAMQPDPLREIRRGLSAARVVETHKIDGQPATVVELTKSLHTIISGLHTGYRLGVPATMRLTITDADGIIRQTAIDYPVADMANFGLASPTRSLLLASEHQKIIIDPVLKSDLFTMPAQLAPPANPAPPR